ncbi:MAG TPA: hypothetical protein PLG07_05890, partial [Phenylobacterium sp.]|nr:hypothetical protein [Phenylobacterium sp.]
RLGFCGSCRSQPARRSPAGSAYETARRHAHKLIRLGFCERAETGKIRLGEDLKTRDSTRAYLAVTVAETIRLAQRLRPADLAAVAA